MGEIFLFKCAAFILGLYMAWNIGANDVANAMGTSVGSRALTLKKAVLIAAVLEFCGAFFMGSSVSQTIQGGIIHLPHFQHDPNSFVLGMLGALLSTSLLLQTASYFGLPVSTTHAIVGAILGFGAIAGGIDAIQWGAMGKITASWVLSPILSGITSYFIFFLLQRFAIVYLPASSPSQNFHPHPEKVFIYPQIASACLIAFAHGANDVANAIGPVAAILNTLQTQTLELHSPVPPWLLLLGGIGIVLGLATWGWRVIETIGKKITELTPMRGFAAELGAGITILFASKLGLPISTTHALVGAICGVGIARGVKALNFRMLTEIMVSWLVTVPLCAIVSVILFYLLKLIFL